jgi:hypothetical protein
MLILPENNFFEIHKRENKITPLCSQAKRSLDPRSIMESSGEPVSKYRVKVFVPGRPEYILISGAPTCLGHRSLFFDQQL